MLALGLTLPSCIAMVLGLGASIGPGGAQAGDVQVCTGGGRVEYTDRGCPPAMRATRTVVVERETSPTVAGASGKTDRKAPMRREDGDGTRVTRSPASSKSPRVAHRPATRRGVAAVARSRGERCAMAKAERDAERRRIGLSVDYLTTRRLDERVYDACK